MIFTHISVIFSYSTLTKKEVQYDRGQVHFRHEDADRHPHAERDHLPRGQEFQELQDLPAQLWINTGDGQVLRVARPAQGRVQGADGESRQLPHERGADQSQGAAQQVPLTCYGEPGIRLVLQAVGGDGPQRPPLLPPQAGERQHQGRDHHPHVQPQETGMMRTGSQQ